MEYKVDYCGMMNFLQGAKNTFEAGEEVTLKYCLIGTDTDYSFYLDGKPLKFFYEEGGFVIKFTMPEHDVKFECKAVNTMVQNRGGSFNPFSN